MAESMGVSFCPGCRVGNHKQHNVMWHPAEDCPFGGLKCDCDGRCRFRDDSPANDDDYVDWDPA